MAATLCATSVGITARVLSDLKRTTSKEGQIILGAAVIDDVLGLMVLAVVAGIIIWLVGVPLAALGAYLAIELARRPEAQADVLRLGSGAHLMLAGLLLAVLAH